MKHLEQAGSRYIDFLLPGLLGMGLMGGGLWGVGFVIVDMRVRKLLKRFLATPMRRSDFLLAHHAQPAALHAARRRDPAVFGYLVFGVALPGELPGPDRWRVLLGGVSFAGIGLLVASRAQTIETVSGLMNLVMLPMWILSGVFFSSERFPEVVQPLINLLPLTALNQLLRGIMLEGQSLPALWPQVAILAGYGVGTFTIALQDLPLEVTLHLARLDRFGFGSCCTTFRSQRPRRLAFRSLSATSSEAMNASMKPASSPRSRIAAASVIGRISRRDSSL